MRILFSVLILALPLSAPGPAQALEKRAAEPETEATAPPRKSKPSATRAPAADPYGALVENVSRSTDEFRNDNTRHNQDRDRLENADNAQSAPATGKKPPRTKQKKSPP